MPFLTNNEFCELLRCSETTVWRLRKEPGFPQPGKLGRRLRWDYEKVEQARAFINNEKP